MMKYIFLLLLIPLFLTGNEQIKLHQKLEDLKNNPQKQQMSQEIPFITGTVVKTVFTKGEVQLTIPGTDKPVKIRFPLSKRHKFYSRKGVKFLLFKDIRPGAKMNIISPELYSDLQQSSVRSNIYYPVRYSELSKH